MLRAYTSGPRQLQNCIQVKRVRMFLNLVNLPVRRAPRVIEPPAFLTQYRGRVERDVRRRSATST